MCHLLPISHSLFSSPTPGRAALGLHSPSPRVCTRGWAYADVITKISRIDRLPNFLTHGAPLARFARRSSAIIPLCGSRGSVRFSCGAVRLFPALLDEGVRPSYGTFFLMVFQGNSARVRTGHMIIMMVIFFFCPGFSPQ